MSGTRKIAWLELASDVCRPECQTSRKPSRRRASIGLSSVLISGVNAGAKVHQQAGVKMHQYGPALTAVDLAAGHLQRSEQASNDIYDATRHAQHFGLEAG